MGADFGGTLVVVKNIVVDSDVEERRVGREETQALLESIGEELPDDAVERIPHNTLGDGCLPADAAEVDALLGTVQLARGGTTDGRTKCQYLGEGNSDVATLTFEYQGGLDPLPPLESDEFAQTVSIDGAEDATAMESENSTTLTIQPTPEEYASLYLFAPAVEDGLSRSEVTDLAATMLESAR